MGDTKFSRHMTRDREARYLTIATKVGFGEVLYTTTYSDHNNRWRNRTLELTSTGVCIVRAENKTVVTLYCATISTVKTYFKMDRIPPALFAAIRSNEKRGYCNL